MQRTVQNVPEPHVELVKSLMMADGLTEIDVVKQPDGLFTIHGRAPAANGGMSAPGVSTEAAAFMLEHEAFIPFRYFDVSKNATIGYGHHRGKTAIQIDSEFPSGLTEEDAWNLFVKDLNDFAKSVKKKTPAGLSQPRFDALVMVAFGRGNIHAEAKLLKSGDHANVADSIESIKTSGGKFNAGVAKRYAKVANIYRHGIYPKPQLSRAELRKRGIKLIEKLFPNKLNSVGNKFGLPTEDTQRQQAEEAYFRMTGKPI